MGDAQPAEKLMTMRSSILLDIGDFIGKIGLDASALMEMVGIDRSYLDDPDMAVPSRAVIALYELAAERSGYDDFGIRLAEATGLIDFGAINLVLRTGDSVREALHALIGFFHIYSDAARLELVEGAGGPPMLTVAIRGSQQQCSRQIMDASIAQLTKTIRSLLQDSWAPEAVYFMHAQPASTARHMVYFRCPIGHLRPCNAIVLRAGDLDQPLSRSLPILRQQLERYLRGLGAISDDNFANRIAAMVTKAFPEGKAHADLIAGSLHITRRTLNRRLAKAGLNFSTILATARRELVVQYLADPEQSVSEIAALVGFGSVSAFSAWFRTDFGVSATEWRRRCGL